MPWQLLDHTADVRLEVEAASWPGLLEEAAAAFGGFVGGGQTGRTEARPVTLSGSDPVEVWVRWWRTLLRLWTVERVLPVRAEMLGSDPRVLAVPAAALDLSRCEDIKAVTWHAASVEQAAPGCWRGTIVLDV